MFIRKYIPLVIVIGLCLIAQIIIYQNALDRSKHKLITIEPEDETSIRYTVEEKHNAAVSSLLGLNTRMAYYVTYIDGNETKDALVEESLYHKITDTIYITTTISIAPRLVAIFLIMGSAGIATAVLVAKDLNLGAVLRNLIKKSK